jgi:predicted dehydrogenase
MVEKLIRWGIWGTGAIAHSAAEDLRLVSGTLLHGVASRRIESARSFAAQHGIARFYTGLQALLDDPEIDVVYVASPNHCHLDDSLSCIQAGKALLCEKPFALNLDQAQRIVDAARQRNVFCMEAMWTRFIPAVIEAKRCIDAGVIGSIRLIQGNFSYPVPAGSEARFFDRELGGGALLDRGVYLISLAQHLLGVSQSIGGTAYLGPTGVDEQSGYQLAYAGGALAVLAASLRVRGTNEVWIFGDGGFLRLCEPFYRAHRLVLRQYAQQQAAAGEGSRPNSRGAGRILGGVRNSPTAKLLLRRFSPLRALLTRGRVRSFPFPGNGYQFQFTEVSRCVREQRKESAIMPLDDSLEVMRTMDALRAQWGPAYPHVTAP